MNKLVACALLGFGLTQVLVGCGDDDDAIEGGSGNATGGTASAGKGGGATTAGSATGGKATGGNNATAGTGGKAGSSTGGTATAGTGNVGGEAIGGEGGGGGVGGEAIGGEGSLGGAGGAAGGAGPVEPDPEPQEATEHWLSVFCDAKSKEVLMCDSSPEWGQCFNVYQPFLPAYGEGLCEGDSEDDPVKTVALMDALVALAAACPSPDVDQWRCSFGAPQAKDQECRDADEARRVASMNCGL